MLKTHSKLEADGDAFIGLKMTLKHTQDLKDLFDLKSDTSNFILATHIFNAGVRAQIRKISRRKVKVKLLTLQSQ